MVDENLIIDKLSRQDPTAINWLVDTFSRPVYHVIFTYLQDKNDAEEICNDVFIAVLDSIGSFNRKSSLKTWIHRIAINKALDFIKYRNRKKRAGILVPLSDQNSEEPGINLVDFRHPGLELEHKEMHDAVFSAINELPDNQKITLVQSCFEKQTHKEIARILGLSEKAVESLLYRAKANLRLKLEKIFDNLKNEPRESA